MLLRFTSNIQQIGLYCPVTWLYFYYCDLLAILTGYYRVRSLDVIVQTQVVGTNW